MFRSTSTGAAVMMDDCNSVTSDNASTQFETTSILNSGDSSPSSNQRSQSTDTTMQQYNDNQHHRYQMQPSLSESITWQRGRADSPYRHRMVIQIVKILKQRTKPDCPKQWLDKLPKMAKRLESCLYRSALSFEGYNDNSTLEERLKEMAFLVARPNLESTPTSSSSNISRRSSEISTSSFGMSLADSRHVEGASALTALRAGIHPGRRKSWSVEKTQVRFH